MRIHILGICGTFMGGVAKLARELGHQVTGCDTNVYPPMSTQLEDLGIPLHEGYDPAQLSPRPDLVIIGNVISRGNSCVEAVLDQGIPYTSGPAWLAENVLQSRWVLAVAGTHGKTTTASMLAWILDDAGMAPGFLIGGVSEQLGCSAQLSESSFFVIEADEYDSAFFDKRSKFVHYRPRTLILNNLEFDHADIFADLAAIERQFHHLMRTVPNMGRVICATDEPALARVIEMGCWTPIEWADGDGAHWRIEPKTQDFSRFSVYFETRYQGDVNWSLRGRHNAHNGLMAIAAARHIGVTPEYGIDALNRFITPKRRLEWVGMAQGITIYDDFAHHPTAIEATLEAMQGDREQGRVLAVLEPRSNTMRLGVHQHQLADSLRGADEVFLFAPSNLSWDPERDIASKLPSAKVYCEHQQLLEAILSEAKAGDRIVVMSNGGFGHLPVRLLMSLQEV